MGISKNSGTPKWMVKIMESPIKIDDFQVPLFLETSISKLLVRKYPFVVGQQLADTETPPDLVANQPLYSLILCIPQTENNHPKKKKRLESKKLMVCNYSWWLNQPM